MPNQYVNDQLARPVGGVKRYRRPTLRKDSPSPIRVEADLSQRYPGASRRAAETMLNLTRTAEMWTDWVSEIVANEGLTIGAANVLAILDSAGKPLPPHKLSERLVVSRAHVTGLLDVLEIGSLIRRRQHPDDRRMLLIELTATGRSVVRSFRPALHKAEIAALSDLPMTRQTLLLETLQNIQTQVYRHR